MTLQIDGVPFMIVAEPCYFNSELQYKVSINGGEEIMFVFDTELGRYNATGDASVFVPDVVELAIGEGLDLDVAIRRGAGAALRFEVTHVRDGLSFAVRRVGASELRSCNAPSPHH